MAELIIPFQKLVLSNLNLTLHLDFKINLLIIMLNLISSSTTDSLDSRFHIHAKHYF